MNSPALSHSHSRKANLLSCFVFILCTLLLCLISFSARGDTPFVTDEILVGYKTSANLPAFSQSPVHGKRIGLLKPLRVERIKLPAGMTIAQAMAQYQNMPGVQFVERNHILHVASTPNDPGYSSSQYAPRKIQADLAWDIWQPQSQVIVAIIDTGVDNGHPDLTNKILRDANGIVGWNSSVIDPATGLAGARDNALDDFGHGTHVSGIAAAQTNNGLGIAGVAGWDGNATHSDVSVKIMPVKVLVNGSGSDADVAAGLVWAVDHGAKVLNMSLGDTEYSSTLDSACQYAWSKNCVIVAAAGNNGSNTLFYPAALNHVISVAATDGSDELASFSNWGTWVQVAAPGVDVFSTLPTYSSGFGTNYGVLSGTSMATPHVAGEAALLLAQNPALTNAQVVNLIESYVDDYTAAGGRTLNATGGRINVLKALQAATNPQPPNTPNGFTATLQNTSILLSWRPTSGADSYNLYRSLTPGGEGATPYKTGLTGLTSTDIGVIGTSYYYQLTAVSSLGESLRTAELKVTPDGSLYRINCGGEAIGLFAADAYFVGGAPYYAGGTVDVSGAVNPAPPIAYQSVRAALGSFGYSFPGLTPGNFYKVRLHFAEDFWTTPGQRPFDVSINGSLVLAGFDPFTAAGAGFKAVIKEFNIAADSAGSMNIVLSSAQNLSPIICAIEILSGTAQTPSVPTSLIATAGNGQVSLRWNLSAGAATYNLYRSTTTGGEGATPYKTGLTTTSCTDTAVTNGTTYFYTVSAVNSVGESGQSTEASATPDSSLPNYLYQINSGGQAVGTFSADNFFSSGNVYSFSTPVDISGVANPAPAAVYQSLRYLNPQFGYTLPNLTASGAYKVRLHFVEVAASSPGGRVFNVSINGTQVLSNFDIFAVAGGQYKAVVKEFNVNADANGKINLNFVSAGSAGPCVSAIEVLAAAPSAPDVPTGLKATAGTSQIALTWNTVSSASTYNLYRSTTAGGEGATPYKTGLTTTSYTDTAVTNGTTYFYKVTAVNTVGESAQSSEASATPSAGSTAVYQINSGGQAVGTFSADNFFSSGNVYSFSTPVDISGVANPAPAAVYQSLRYLNPQFGYTLPNLTANGAYKVRLHFVEVAASSPGGRVFNVSINGTQVLSNFDIFAAAGGQYKAVVKEFNVNADANGKINLNFVSASNAGPCVSAIEVLTAAPVAPSTPTGLTATAGTSQIALTWSAASGATTYNLYRSTSSGGEGTTPYKTGLTSASYTDTAVTNGTTYFYKVTAVNSVGESAQSSEVSATPTAGSVPIYQINSGGQAVGTFSADNFFTSGTVYAFSNPVDISGVTNPAPAAVYQSLRYLNPQFGYVLPNLTANGAYKVRLHFVEVAASSSGGRVFNVSINGGQVLNNFDIFAAAGGRYKAVVREFNVNADANGKINLNFVSASNDGPCVSAIEVLNGS